MARFELVTPSDALDDGPFFHGTKVALAAGDLLTAGRPSNYRPEIRMNHVYITALRDGAGLSAELAVVLAAGQGEPHVYLVEPTGGFENDPNVTDKRFPGNPTRGRTVVVMDHPVASRRLRSASAVLALLLFSAQPSMAATKKTTKKTTAEATTRVIADCWETAIRPKTIGLACADGYLQLIDAKWSTWTATRATGTGTYLYNDCEPYCAAGTIHRVKSTFTLHGVVVTKKYGRLFGKVLVRWAGKSQEYDLPTSLLSDVVAETATTAR